MVLINWTERAELDLKSIHDFIASDSKRYAERQVTRIVVNTKHLEHHIFLGREVPEIGEKYIREIILDQYRIVYRIVNKEQLDILTIHHSSRDFDRRIFEIT